MHDVFVEPMIGKMEHYDLHQHDHPYGSDHIIEMETTHHSPPHSPPQPYPSAFDFQSPTQAQFDQTYNSAPYHTTYSSPQPLHPLNTTTLWPSQLTNPSATGSQPIQPVQPRALAPATHDGASSSDPEPSPPPPKHPHTMPSSRRTLTDNDRRRMCKYHDENPHVKQTEIGAMFGVERSTVSKVLRNKEKYLVAEDGRRSPVKRHKSKFPDIERTLTNWAKKRLSEGQPFTDDIIKEEARKFATTLGSAECHEHLNDPVWLEKFKQKNELPGAKPKGEKITADSLNPKSGFQTPSVASSGVGWDGLPVTQSRADSIKAERSPDMIFDNTNPWGHTHSQSTASLGTVFSDATLSNDFQSPTSPFFSPLSSSGPSPAMPAQKAPRLPTLAPAKLPRRQTVPLTGSADESPNSATSRNGAQQLPPPSSLDPRGYHDGMDISHIGIDTTNLRHRPSTTGPMHPNGGGSNTSPPTVHTSPFSMGPPSTNISPSIGSMTSPSSAAASPSSPPSQDEARAALETLRKFIEHQPSGSVDPHDYLVMGKWMQMLKLEGGVLPGGMCTIPMAERADGTAPMGRKRSEHSLS